MSVSHTRIECDGEMAGFAMTLGDRYVFYAANNAVKPLDGQRFSSLVSLRRAVATAMGVQTPLKPRSNAPLEVKGAA